MKINKTEVKLWGTIFITHMADHLQVAMHTGRTMMWKCTIFRSRNKLAMSSLTIISTNTRSTKTGILILLQLLLLNLSRQCTQCKFSQQPGIGCQLYKFAQTSKLWSQWPGNWRPNEIWPSNLWWCHTSPHQHPYHGSRWQGCFIEENKSASHSYINSVRRSSPRTGKGLRTGQDRTDLGQDHGPGPCLFKEFAVWSYYFQPDLRTGPDQGPILKRCDTLPVSLCLNLPSLEGELCSCIDSKSRIIMKPLPKG